MENKFINHRLTIINDSIKNLELCQLKINLIKITII